MFGMRSKIKVEAELIIDDRCSNDVINCLQDANRHIELHKAKSNFVSSVGKENGDVNRTDVKNDIITLKHEPELVIFDVHANIPMIACHKYPLVALRDCLPTRKSVVEPSSKTAIATDEACNQVLVDATPLEEHITSDEMENGRSFQCYKCRKDFHDDKECRRHMFSLCLCNKIPILRLVDCMKTSGCKTNRKSSSGNSVVREFECYICKQTFDGADSLPKHLMESHRVNVTENRGRIHHRFGTFPRPYACKYSECHRKYKSKYDLAAHIATHSGKREHICTYPNCNGAYFTAKYLKIHKRTVHSDERKYVCAYRKCGKTFKCRGSLRIHESSHNDDAKRHVCEYVNCGKGFISKSKLTRHFLTHMENRPRPYVCTVPQCGKSYALKEILQIHRVTHVEDKPFACDICKKQFKWKRSFVVHKRAHSNARPFRCDQKNCAKSFKSTGELKVHKLTHSEERGYACAHSKCSKAFKTYALLAFHKRVHSSDKPFVCTNARCGKAFKSRPNLNRHQKTKGHHHMDKS